MKEICVISRNCRKEIKTTQVVLRIHHLFRHTVSPWICEFLKLPTTKAVVTTAVRLRFDWNSTATTITTRLLRCDLNT